MSLREIRSIAPGNGNACDRQGGRSHVGQRHDLGGASRAQGHRGEVQTGGSKSCGRTNSGKANFLRTAGSTIRDTEHRRAGA